MRYLRMLSNSMAAALLASAYIVLLVLDLNPTLPLRLSGLEPIAIRIGGFYALHLSALWYALLLARRAFAPGVFSPAWASVGELTWMAALSAAAGAGLMWANLQTFAVVLGASTRDHLIAGATELGIAALAFAAIGVARVRLAGHGRRALAAALAATAAVSIAGPLLARGPGRPPLLEARALDLGVEPVTPERAAQVTVIAIDGASLDFITGETVEGRLPNFGRVLDTGAVRRLATLHPTSAEAVWAAASTGKLPEKNGVRSAAMYRLADGREALEVLPDHCFARALVRSGVLVEEPHTSATLRTRTLFSILSRAGVSIGVVGWPLTSPAPIVRGYIVSDAYLRLSATPSPADQAAAVSPADLQLPAPRAIDPVAEPGDLPAEPGPDPAFGLHERPARTDRLVDRFARALADDHPTQFHATRFQGLDAIGHYFLRYAQPEAFGDVTESERRRLGATLGRHYGLIDEAIGRAMAGLGQDDLLLVVSGYGMEPVGVARRMVERVVGDPELSGTHDAAPDGFLMAYGSMVARGRQPSRASVFDVTPTILYFLGLPIGRDMDGYARTDLFERAFTDERPITFIPTYDR